MLSWKLYITIKKDKNLSDYRKILKEDGIKVLSSIEDNTIPISINEDEEIEKIQSKYRWISQAIPMTEPIAIEYPAGYLKKRQNRKGRRERK